MPEPSAKDMQAAREALCTCGAQHATAAFHAMYCAYRFRAKDTAEALAAAREEGRAEERAAWEESHGFYLCVSKKQAQADINESHGEALAWQAKAKAAQDFAQTMQHERDFAQGVEAPAEYDRGRAAGDAAGFERGRRQGMEEACRARCGSCAKGIGVSPDGEIHDNGRFCNAAELRALIPQEENR